MDLHIANAFFDAANNLIVDLAWSMRDRLSDLADNPADRVQSLVLKVNGEAFSTIDNLAVSAEAPGVAPWQPHRFDVAGTHTLTIPPPQEEPGEPAQWSAGAVLIHAETGPNATGRTGWDQCAVYLAWHEGVLPDAIEILELGDWPPEEDGGISPHISLLLEGTEDLEGSPEGSFEPVVFRLPVLTPETANQLTVTANGVDQLLAPFTYSPEQHYVVSPDNLGRPRILVITADELPPGMSSIKPSNIDHLVSEGELKWFVFGDQSGILRDVEVQVLPPGLEPLIGDHAARDGPTTLEEVLAAFLTLYGEPGAELLKYYQEGGNHIVVEGILFGQLKVKYLSESDGKVLIRVEEDLDPFEAAQLLAAGLNRARGLPPVGNAIPSTDYAALINAYQGSFEAATGYAAGGARLYYSGVLMVTDTGGDIIFVVSDLADGNWGSAAVSACFAAIPLASRAVIAEGTELAIRASRGGDNLFTANSAQAAALKRAILEHSDIVAKYDELVPHFNAADRVNFAKAGIVWKPMSKSGARARAKRLKGDPPPGMVNPQIHHDCPLEFQEWFLAHGIDINDPQFTRYIPQSAHGNILHIKDPPYTPANTGTYGGRWNAEWKAFIDAEDTTTIGGGYTREQVIQFMESLRASPELRIP